MLRRLQHSHQNNSDENILSSVALDVKQNAKLQLELGMKTMNDRLKSRRQQLAMSQEEVALIAGLTQGQVSKYERGIAMPPADALARLARALNTSTDWLAGLTDEVQEIGNEEELSDLEREVINVMRTKPLDQQRKILEIARML